MPCSGHVENHIVAGEADFDQNFFTCHFPEKTLGLGFQHHVNSVTNALGMATLD